MADAKKKAPAKPAAKPADKRGDPHDRIDKLEDLMRANGWTV